MAEDRENALASVVAPEAEHVSQHDPFDMYDDEPDKLMEQMRLQAAEHGSEELARAHRYVESQPFKALGWADAPVEVSRSMDARGSVWGNSDAVRAVSIKYGSEMEMFGPDPNRDLPLVEISVGLELEDSFMGPDHASQNASWLAHTTTMILNPLEDPQSTRESQDWFKQIEQQGKDLDSSFEATAISVDGTEHPAEIARTEVGYVARCKVGDRFISIKAVNVGPDLPVLVAVEDFQPYLAGLASSMDYVASMMREAQTTMGKERAPAEAQAAKRMVEVLGRNLQKAGDGWGAPTRKTDPVTLFSRAVIEAWGGPEKFRSRFALYAGVVDISGKFIRTTEDGSVALMRITVGLPRPNGGGSMTISVSDEPWWQISTEEILLTANRQMERGQMPEYELELNALARRTDEGTYVIDTDVFTLVNQFTGGLQELLRPARG